MIRRFEDQFTPIQKDIASVCLEYAEGAADTIFIHALCEGDIISSNFFYRVNGQLKKKHQLNNNSDGLIDTSSKRQQAVLDALNDDVEKIKALCAGSKQPMPTEMKIFFDVKKKALSAKYRYEPVYTGSADKTAMTVFEDWFAQITGGLTGGVLNYLLTETAMTEKEALDTFHDLEKYQDILEEFTKWIQTRKYLAQDAIRVEGYTAQKLVESTRLSPVGAYNYLIALREKPEEALDWLKRGLPIK